MITLVDTVTQPLPQLAIPAGLRGDRAESQPVDLLEVSPEAVRIGHEKELEGGALCTLILPCTPDALQLPARIMWTHSWETRATRKGEPRFHHESRLIFLQPLPAPQIPRARAFLKVPLTGAGSKKPE